MSNALAVLAMAEELASIARRLQTMFPLRPDTPPQPFCFARQMTWGCLAETPRRPVDDTDNYRFIFTLRIGWLPLANAPQEPRPGRQFLLVTGLGADASAINTEPIIVVDFGRPVLHNDGHPTGSMDVPCARMYKQDNKWSVHRELLHLAEGQTVKAWPAEIITAAIPSAK